jgi:pimeloyl-ACP methyl ester carboxylesterase
MRGTPTLLLVHGAWHGPWCWEKLTPELDARGIAWRTVALPCVGDDPAALGGVAEDAYVIAAAAAEIRGNVVVLAHSYGGIPTTEARLGSNVKRLIYLGAFMPDAGQALVDLLPPGPLPPFVLDNGDGTTSVRPDLAVATFYADCDAETAAWAVRQLRRHNGICNVTKVTRANWRALASSYILLTEDFACPTVTQRQVSRQADEVFEITGCHSPFLSKPAELADVVHRILGHVSDNGVRRSA